MDLKYDIQGEGTPILLIHSPGVDSREWMFLVPMLARTNRVITFDGRGTGQSPAPLEPINLVEDVHRLLQHLHLEKVALLGHSMGGQTATDFTLTYPGMVECLILLAPSLTGFNYSPEFVDWMAQINSLAPDIGKMVEFSLSGPNYAVVMTSPQRDFLTEMQTQYMIRVFTEWKSFEVIWPEPAAITRLEQIDCPALFVSGSVEWNDMRLVAHEFERLPAVRFVEISGADHMLALTHPQELASAVQEFMRKTVG